jgi:hypothetical protein
MSLEKRLVERHVLDGHQPLGGLILHHPVDQQKWVPVRQQIQDLLDIERHAQAPDKRAAAADSRSTGL